MPDETQVSAVAALDEPTRRRLYSYVVAQPGPVGRDEAAAAAEVPRSTAAFHLDRLVDEGLLAVVHQRRTGRTGPGAGRPAKLYRRSEQQISVSLPERRYELVGRLLAAAVAEADQSGESPRLVLDRHAADLGAELADAARSAEPNRDPEDTLVHSLQHYGFEPRVDGEHIVLGNCPFHSLARQHTELVCGTNLRLLDGLRSRLGAGNLSARLSPTPDHCCVRFERTDRQAPPV